jgi:hypothetical protein
MPITQEAQAKTRSFARVLGPFLMIVPGIIVVRLSEVAPLAAPFFANPALVFTMGALMVFGGICVIANHQIWRGLSAILISLFGRFICLRGLALLLAPQAYEHLADVSQGALPLVRLLFGLIFLAGLKPTYDGWIAKPPVEQ